MSSGIFWNQRCLKGETRVRIEIFPLVRFFVQPDIMRTGFEFLLGSPRSRLTTAFRSLELSGN